uniref:Uncharacterized protein n=1 Tax=Setaria italica TaxID=4555 RepID=K3YB83_SETIT
MRTYPTTRALEGLATFELHDTQTQTRRHAELAEQTSSRAPGACPARPCPRLWPYQSLLYSLPPLNLLHRVERRKWRLIQQEGNSIQ